jgi:hypothetical protein
MRNSQMSSALLLALILSACSTNITEQKNLPDNSYVIVHGQRSATTSLNPEIPKQWAYQKFNGIELPLPLSTVLEKAPSGDCLGAYSEPPYDQSRISADYFAFNLCKISVKSAQEFLDEVCDDEELLFEEKGVKMYLNVPKDDINIIKYSPNCSPGIAYILETKTDVYRIVLAGDESIDGIINAEKAFLNLRITSN